jgi:uncharacterized protein YggU (UPF0235/DUF167 family)
MIYTLGMNITVMVKANAKKNDVRFENDLYYVHTQSPSRDGKANISVIYLLSQYLKIPQSNLKIKLGFKSRKKVVEISE